MYFHPQHSVRDEYFILVDNWHENSNSTFMVKNILHSMLIDTSLYMDSILTKLRKLCAKKRKNVRRSIPSVTLASIR